LTLTDYEIKQIISISNDIAKIFQIMKWEWKTNTINGIPTANDIAGVLILHYTAHRSNPFEIQFTECGRIVLQTILEDDTISEIRVHINIDHILVGPSNV